MRKQGDIAASIPKTTRIIPRLAPGGLYERAIPRLAFNKSPHAQAGGYCGVHPEAARIIPRLAPGGFYGNAIPRKNPLPSLFWRDGGDAVLSQLFGLIHRVVGPGQQRVEALVG